VLEGEEEIRPTRLPNWLTGETVAVPPTSSVLLTLPPQGLSLDDLEKDLIRQALERTNYNKTQAAKLLGLSYDAFRYQVKKFGASGDAGSCEM
jgi:two-component system response regulator AtoC